jgi:hypothetical protein
MTTNRAPLITAIVLLLLPVLYVGSYLALVIPRGTFVASPSGSTFTDFADGRGTRSADFVYFRWGSRVAQRFFWPLEQIDRKVRPGAWEPTHHWEPVGGGAGPIKLP